MQAIRVFVHVCMKGRGLDVHPFAAACQRSQAGRQQANLSCKRQVCKLPNRPVPAPMLTGGVCSVAIKELQWPLGGYKERRHVAVLL